MASTHIGSAVEVATDPELDGSYQHHHQDLTQVQSLGWTEEWVQVGEQNE